MISTLLVGFGFSAQTFHLPFITGLDDYSLCGVVSSRPDEVHKVLPDVAVYATLEEALEHAAPQLCVITTPNHLHYAQAAQCLESDSHVLVEKPFTLSAADAEALCGLATSRNKTLHVYHNRRYDGDFLTLKALVAQDRFGGIKRMVSRFDRFRPVPKNRWRENAGPGAGIFWDLGPHLLDQCVQLFGLPEAVSATIKTLRDNGQSDDFFEVNLHYPDTLVQVGSSPYQGGETLRFDVQGPAGSFRKYGLDPQEQQLKNGMAITDTQFGIESDESFGKFCFETDGEVIPTLAGDYIGFYRQLAASIGEGAPSPASATSVVPVIRLIEWAFESALNDAPVRIKD